MNAREAILARLRTWDRDQSLPPAWRSRRHFEDLAVRFAESLTKAGGEVYRAASLAAALDRLDDLLEELEVRRAVMNFESPLRDLDLLGRWPGVEWHLVGQTQGDLRSFCAGADVGLSGAQGALAETGTVVVESGPGKSRLATLLPPIHIALVSESLLTTDLFTWVAARQAQPTAVTLISGPSKTADIEQTLAIGVHGPKRMIVVLYPEKFN